ncbi:Leucine--tRNA ligase [Candidatus Bilamarchaeum dharawalense]|uniref:Leucine--tRNA ligase n=1 Tax=Candidatus Bilamarchaeum dharawalense TaxID=2885759 RepID=A0A5E4LRM2_9ARCH|nr:Leucine--tRNA ligase [Candidatus Bilamarchaeum dharawalense]
MDSTTLEKKWSTRWTEAKVFQVDPVSTKEKKYITAAFPYPNSPQHIGHGRTYTTTDIYVRYLRLLGYNVLFPMAFHVTGTPIIAMAKRIADKDEDVLSVFERIYGISRETAAGLTEPRNLVMHFSHEIEEGMKEMGYSIDWRRKFYSFDQRFNKFIEWQFKKFKDMGLLVQGEHAVPWCPKDNNAVGAHDTKGDVDPEIKEFMWIKFRLKNSDLILVTGTTRPDALLGQSNLWIDPHGKYKIVQVKDEKWVVGDAAIAKIHSQFDSNAKIIGEITAKELIGKWAKGPIVNYELYILPAGFIDITVGSGLVYSALEDPVDLYELRKIQADSTLVKQYGLDPNVVAKLKPIPIINVEGMGEDLGDSIGKEFGVTSADQKDKLEEAKGELNRRVFRKGIMKNSCGKYSGMSVPDCQELIKKDLQKSQDGVMFWEIDNKPVYCRCGAEVIANVVKNQWFLNYGDESWKTKARECINSMSIIPEKNRADYLYIAGWLREKACTRAAGLGTRFPFDKTQMIEALSDSTIYMAFYTIAHLLNDFTPEQLDEKFFDYVLLGKGSGNAKLDKIRESFVYWYPLDSRHSGADLVRNHLPFFIFNHVAIFDKKHWPKQIVTNGFVLMDGKKMSKSMGNILPLRKAITEYGADVIRFSVVCGADLSSDTDFNKTVAEGTRTRIEQIAKMVESSGKAWKILMGSPASTADPLYGTHIGKWLNSRLNRRIQKASALYEKIQMRELSLEIFYGVFDDLKWYGKRNNGDYSGLHSFFVKWIPLIAPFMPHYAEEFWEMSGQTGLVATAKFPEVDPSVISDEVEAGEALVVKVREDIDNLETLLKKKPTKISIFVANDLKRRIYTIIAKEKAFDKIMKAASGDPEMKTKMDVVQKMAKSLAKNVHSLGSVSSAADELVALISAIDFFKNEFKCEIEVMLEDKSQHERAKNAMPGKPAIVLD